MALDEIANIAEISAAILVVASLIYVGRQLKQNTQSMRLKIVQAISAEWMYGRCTNRLNRCPISENQQGQVLLVMPF